MAAQRRRDDCDSSGGSSIVGFSLTIARVRARYDDKDDGPIPRHSSG